MKKLFVLLLGTATLFACGKDAGNVAVPEVDLSCTTSRCTSASGPYDAYSVITSEGCAPDQIDSNYIAGGSTTVQCSASGCTGTVSSWKDETAQSISEMPSGTYYVCNWIDFNNNGVKNGTDEFSELRETILSASNIDADGPTWGVTYASRGRTND